MEDITGDEMAGILQRAVNFSLSGIADAPHGSSFELTSPATGQRFRITVAEVSAGDAVDAAIEACRGN